MSIKDIGFSCSLCGRSREEVKIILLIRSSNQKICNECIETCYSVIKNADKKKEFIDENIPTPKEIYQQLEETIEGQHQAKKILSVAVYNHYKRLINNITQKDSIEIEKSNILLLGPSGCGKTMLCKKLSEIINVPFASVDATSLTEVGYVGFDADECISLLLQNSDYNVKRAETGIVLIDEFDKIKQNNSNGNKDVSGIGVQHDLLKIIEGTNVSVPINGKKSNTNHQENIQINTKNILFVFAGAFNGLSKIISKDVGIRDEDVGFLKSDNSTNYLEIIKHLKQEHLIKYGFINEIIGRLHIKTSVEELTINNLVSILVKKQNSIIQQYNQLLNIRDNLNLEITDDAVKIIAEKAKKNKTGARGLKTIMENLLNETIFENVDHMSQNRIIVIDDQVVKGKCKPKIIQKNELASSL